jgi:asparagine synthase (glutamine-hydrolysing)
MKSLVDWCAKVTPFPPSHYWDSESKNFKRHFELKNELRDESQIPGFNKEQALAEVKKSFQEAIDKRLMSDREIGCFLSGGLDSSLVTALVS